MILKVLAKQTKKKKILLQNNFFLNWFFFFSFRYKDRDTLSYLYIYCWNNISVEILLCVFYLINTRKYLLEPDCLSILMQLQI